MYSERGAFFMHKHLVVRNKLRRFKETNKRDMSLDVYLKDPTATYESTLYNTNITHNLAKMAKEAAIYDVLWQPLHSGFTTASEISDILKSGLVAMLENQDYYRKFDSDNGWGIYDDFIPFIRGYYEACVAYPDAIIEVSV